MKRQSTNGKSKKNESSAAGSSSNAPLVEVSTSTLLWSAAVCALVSFTVGYSIDPLLTWYEHWLQERQNASDEILYIREQDETFGECGSAFHPISFFRKKSQAPPTKYSSKRFFDNHSNNKEEECSAVFEDNTSPNTSKRFSRERRLPSGGHLLVDMRGVDGDFLDSAARLGHAIVMTASESSLSLLSFHCHQMEPSGVSCIGLMSEGYMSFHTWPEDEVITFDMFASGTFEITDAMPSIERNFGVSQNGPPTVIWGHKLRGLKDGVKTTDLTRRILGFTGVDVKKEVASFETKHQKIQVHEVVKKDLAKIMNDSHEPNRILHLNGAIQSSQPSFYEALVHPAMFSHENPQHVVIAGGGYGAALREVLKHSSVQSATMIELDQHVVEVTREFLPELHNCTDLVGVADVCLDDTRATVYYEDAEAWFVNRYSSKPSDKDLLDVVIIDTIDPRVDLPSSDQLHEHTRFVQSLYNSLSNGGVVVMLMGKAPGIADSPDTPPFKHRDIMTRMLQDAGFHGTVAYEEAHGGFHGPRSFLVAFKSDKSHTYWLANEAIKEHDMMSRAVPTASGASPFRYFDGSTMVSYQQQQQESLTAVPDCIPQDALVRHLEKIQNPLDWSNALSQLPAICNDKKPNVISEL